MSENALASQILATTITRTQHKHTDFVIRFLVDRDRIPDAYRAYAYFRWVDDQLDTGELPRAERLAFIGRQRGLAEGCYRGEWPENPSPEESMLVDLIRGDAAPNGRLQAYIRNMLAVMAFDAERKDRTISAQELSQHTHWLAVAVTEALHHFIGHNCPPPPLESRYLAADAAHITHMLRDAAEDVENGFYNIPREVLHAHRLDPRDMQNSQYRNWVESRVRLARDRFAAGKGYLARVENLRCRLAGYAYIARFEGVLDVIEGDGFALHGSYPENKGLDTWLSVGWQMFARTGNKPARPLAVPIRTNEKIRQS